MRIKEQETRLTLHEHDDDDDDDDDDLICSCALVGFIFKSYYRNAGHGSFKISNGIATPFGRSHAPVVKDYRMHECMN